MHLTSLLARQWNTWRAYLEMLRQQGRLRQPRRDSMGKSSSLMATSKQGAVPKVTYGHWSCPQLRFHSAQRQNKAKGRAAMEQCTHSGVMRMPVGGHVHASVGSQLSQLTAPGR